METRKASSPPFFPRQSFSMGQKSSRTAPEHATEDDNHSAWGSDIDESLCGPGKICADEWTPMNSREASPEDVRRRFSEVTVEDDNVITEQPRAEDIWTNSDAMTVRKEWRESLEVPPLLLAPITTDTMTPRKRRVAKRIKKKKRKKPKKSGRMSVRPSIPADVAVVRSYKAPKNQKRSVIRVRRMRIRQDPRYPAIPPPGTNPRLKFRRCHPDDTFRFTKAVPPRHLKGLSVCPKPHFRYRGVRQIIV